MSYREWVAWLGGAVLWGVLVGAFSGSMNIPSDMRRQIRWEQQQNARQEQLQRCNDAIMRGEKTAC